MLGLKLGDDNVGEDDSGLVVGLNVGGFVAGERVGDKVEIVDVMVGADDGDVGQNSRRAGVISSCVYVRRDIIDKRVEIKMYVRHPQTNK